MYDLWPHRNHIIDFLIHMTCISSSTEIGWKSAQSWRGHCVLATFMLSMLPAYIHVRAWVCTYMYVHAWVCTSDVCTKLRDTFSAELVGWLHEVATATIYLILGAIFMLSRLLSCLCSLEYVHVYTKHMWHTFSAELGSWELEAATATMYVSFTSIALAHAHPHFD